MEWFKVISQFIVGLIWPTTVLTFILLFREEIRSRFRAIKQFRYPGGSATFEVAKEVAKLEEKTEKTGTKIEKTATSNILVGSSQIKVTDPQLAIAQMRIDIEKELFRLSWITLDHDSIKGWTVERHIDELVKSSILEPEFSENLRMFIRISNSIVHETGVADDVKFRSSSIGASLVAQLHYRRKVLEMGQDFEGHGLWHMHRHLSSDVRKYYFWSAVAASMPEFDYNYDIYRESAERYNQKEEAKDRPHDIIYILSLDEFVKVLEFREKELLRLINAWHNPQGDTWKAFEKANYWQWPAEWGDLGWKGPIIRERLSLYEAEDDLMQTRTALNRYRMRLLEK